MHRRHDHNQTAIVAALRAAGATVADLAGVGNGCPDLLVGAWLPCPCCGQPVAMNVLIEIKNVNGRGPRLTPAEAAFHASWGGQIATVLTVEEALRVIGKE